MDLVLFFEAEGSGEEAGVVGVGLHVGDAPGLVLEAIADARRSSLHRCGDRRSEMALELNSLS